MKITFFAFILLSFFSFIPFCQAETESEVLMNASKRYVDFITGYGAQSKNFELKDLQSLFTSHFNVSINGRIFYETRETYFEKMGEVRKWTKGWNVQLNKIVVSPQNNLSVIQYNCSTEEGTYVTVAILQFNASFLITDIKTIYNKLEDPNKNWFSDLPIQN